MTTPFHARKQIDQHLSAINILKGRNAEKGSLMRTHGDNHPYYGHWYDEIIQNNKTINNLEKNIANIRFQHKLMERFYPKPVVNEEIGYEQMNKNDRIKFHFNLMNIFKKKSIKAHSEGNLEAAEDHRQESNYHWKKAMKMTRGSID